MSDEFDFRNECLRELHTSLVADEGDSDGDNEIWYLWVADDSTFDERYKHLRHHDHLLAHEVELAAIDIDVTAWEIDVVAYAGLLVFLFCTWGIGLVACRLVVVDEDVVDSHLMDVWHGAPIETEDARCLTSVDAEAWTCIEHQEITEGIRISYLTVGIDSVVGGDDHIMDVVVNIGVEVEFHACWIEETDETCIVVVELAVVIG